MSLKFKSLFVASLLVLGGVIGFFSHAVQNNLSLNPLQYLAQIGGAEVTQYGDGSYGAGEYGGGTVDRNRAPVGDRGNFGDGNSHPSDRVQTRTAQNRGEDFSGRTHRLRLGRDNSNIAAFRSRREADLGNDANYRYPLGLYEFEVEVDDGATETITIELDEVYDTSGWTYRKYIDGEYIDITDLVTFATAGGVTTITYDVEDNGPLDSDDRLGFIADPAGPAIPEADAQEDDSGTTDDGADTNDDENREGGGTATDDTASQSSSGSATRIYSRHSSSGNDTNADRRAAFQGITFDTNISFIQPQFNDQQDVRNLEEFLNTFEDEQLAVDGVYDSTDVAAVKRFQQKYSREVLDVWNLTEATGYVGITTRLKMNFLIKGQDASCPVFTEYNGGLNGIMQSDEIGRTQEILQELDMYSGPINNVWDSATNRALITFQETFREVMLDPWNITEGTGYKYKTTNKFLNYFAGCETDAVYLEGIGTYEGI